MLLPNWTIVLILGKNAHRQLLWCSRYMENIYPNLPCNELFIHTLSGCSSIWAVLRRNKWVSTEDCSVKSPLESFCGKRGYRSESKKDNNCGTVKLNNSEVTSGSREGEYWLCLEIILSCHGCCSSANANNMLHTEYFSVSFSTISVLVNNCTFVYSCMYFKKLTGSHWIAYFGLCYSVRPYRNTS